MGAMRRVLAVLSCFGVARALHASLAYPSMLAVAGAMKPSISKLPPVEGYNGCLDEDGALIRDLQAHVAAGKPVLSQLGTELQKPVWYSKNHEYGRRPKYLFHWTSKKDAKLIADAGCILQTEESDGDAYLGKGVYMTAIPGWADPEVVRKNNYGGAMWNKFNKWHKANAYVRVDYEPLVEILEMKPKADWQSNFCIRVPMGKLLLLPKIGAKISWTPTWDRKKREWRECEEWDWVAEDYWRY